MKKKKEMAMGIIEVMANEDVTGFWVY